MNREPFTKAWDEHCALLDLLAIKPMHGAKIVQSLEALKSAIEASWKEYESRHADDEKIAGQGE